MDKLCPECGFPMQLDTNYNPPVWVCSNWDCKLEIEKEDDE